MNENKKNYGKIVGIKVSRFTELVITGNFDDKCFGKVIYTIQYFCLKTL